MTEDTTEYAFDPPAPAHEMETPNLREVLASTKSAHIRITELHSHTDHRFNEVMQWMTGSPDHPIGLAARVAFIGSDLSAMGQGVQKLADAVGSIKQETHTVLVKIANEQVARDAKLMQRDDDAATAQALRDKQASTLMDTYRRDALESQRQSRIQARLVACAFILFALAMVGTTFVRVQLSHETETPSTNPGG